MKDENKTFLKLLSLFLLVSGVVYLYSSAPYDKEIQLLPGSEVANLVEGNFTKLSATHPSGTATDVPFSEYLKNFKSQPKKAIIGENDNGHVKIFYLTKIEDITYVTSELHTTFLTRYVSGEVTGPDTVRLHFERSLFAGIVYWIIAIVASLYVAFKLS